MSETFYRPLTPKMRGQIEESINENMRELETCSSNAFVNAQKIGYTALRKIIRALPDGYPMPMEKK